MGEDDPAPKFLLNPVNWLIEVFCNKPLRWKHRWKWRHNSQPEPGDEAIQSRQGQTYWLRVWESDMMLTLTVFYCGDQVGYARLIWYLDRGYVLLCDICLKPKHRRRGLGRLLLGRVEDYARRRQAPEIRGDVTADGLAEFAGLLNWYRAQGFTVSAPDADNRTDGTRRVAALSKLLL